LLKGLAFLMHFFDEVEEDDDVADDHARPVTMRNAV
jgi:hypothetical protein